MESESFLSIEPVNAEMPEARLDDLDWLHLAGERLLNVTHAVSGADSFPHLLQAVAEACIGIGGAESAGIYMLDPEMRSFTVGWEATVPEWPDALPAGVRLTLGHWHGMMRALDLGRPISWIRNDELLSPFEHDHYANEDVGSGIDVPLVCGGERLGFLKLFRRSMQPWEERDVELTSIVGAMIALALASEQLLTRANQQSRNQTALARIAQVAISQHEPRELLLRVAEEILTLLPFSCVDIEFWTPAVDRCEIVAHAAVPNWPTPTNGVVFYRLSDWPANIRMLRELEIVTIDIDDGLPPNEHEYLERRGLSQLHFVPLLYGESCLGAIILHSVDRVRFDQRVRELVTEAAAITALAARSARAMRDTQWERRAQSWQLQVNNAVLNDASLSVVLDEANASIIDMTGAMASIIAIDHPATGELIEKRFAASGELLLGQVQKFDSPHWPIVHDAISRQHSVTSRIDDRSVGADDAESLRRRGQEWVLATPLVHNERQLGSLSLVFGPDFLATEEVLQFIHSTARHVAVVASDRLLRREQASSARQMAAMLKVTQAAVAGKDLASLFQVVAGSCVELEGVDVCEIEIFNPEQHTLRNALAVFANDWNFPYQEGAEFSIAEWPLYLSAIRDRSPCACLVSDPIVSPSEAEALRALGVESLLIAPLSVGDEVLGVMTLYRRNARRFSSEMVAFAGELAAQASLALERARLFDALQTRADTDGLTGLLNHRSILERIDAALSDAWKTQKPVSLLLIDLDNFKLLNDVNGHLTGDRYLREIGSMIARTVGSRGTVARYGGDEFLVLLPETGAHDGEAIANEILAQGRDEAFDIMGYQVPFLFSIGAASAPHHGWTRDHLIRAADRAMYEAKEQGGGRLGQHTGVEYQLPYGTYSALDGLVQAVDRKDHFTKIHSERVAAVAVTFGEWLGRSQEDVEALYIAGQLHDVGKIAVPDQILRRPGRLTPDEMTLLRQHVFFSEWIVKDVPHLELVTAAIGAHHERWDGAGYPRGLKGEAIPILGRILAIADAYAAMTHDRPYLKARSFADALKEIETGAGTQFDPALVVSLLQFAETGALNDLAPVAPPACIRGATSDGRG